VLSLSTSSECGRRPGLGKPNALRPFPPGPHLFSFGMPLPDWPPWLLIACGVAAAGILVWILLKAVKWLMWLVIVAAIAACAIAAAKFLLK